MSVLGGHVRTAALEQGQLDATHLCAGLLLDHIGQQRRQTTQLGVAKAVGGRGLSLGNEGAVGVVDALGDGHDAVALVPGVDVARRQPGIRSMLKSTSGR